MGHWNHESTHVVRILSLAESFGEKWPTKPYRIAYRILQPKELSKHIGLTGAVRSLSVISHIRFKSTHIGSVLWAGRAAKSSRHVPILPSYTLKLPSIPPVFGSSIPSQTFRGANSLEKASPVPAICLVTTWMVSWRSVLMPLSQDEPRNSELKSLLCSHICVAESRLAKRLLVSDFPHWLMTGIPSS